ncbi:hypothetical protein MGH68_05185 [Erysipelothrix sp. D19-032]
METHTQTNEFIDIFMLNNGKYFPSSQRHEIVQRLRLMPEDRMRYVSTLDFKDPTVSLIISKSWGNSWYRPILHWRYWYGVIKTIHCRWMWRVMVD